MLLLKQFSNVSDWYIYVYIYTHIYIFKFLQIHIILSIYNFPIWKGQLHILVNDIYIHRYTLIHPYSVKSLSGIFKFCVIYVNIRNVQTCREFLWVSLSQTEVNCKEAKPQIWENAPEKGSFAPYFIHYNRKRRHTSQWVTWNPWVQD